MARALTCDVPRAGPRHVPATHWAPLGAQDGGMYSPTRNFIQFTTLNSGLLGVLTHKHLEIAAH
jgi:hypothetical protein